MLPEAVSLHNNIMEQAYEPICNLRVCVSRELTNEEFDLLTDILEDHIGDYIDDDHVIMHDFYIETHDHMFTCYLFSLNDHLVNAKDGAYIGDQLSADLDEHLPADIVWMLEASLPDQEVEVDDDASESEVFESVHDQIKRMLNG